MARLPKPGGDNGNWGDILNEYLSEAHKTDGTLKDNSVTASTIAPGAVTKTTVGLDNVNNTSDADKPVSTATQTALNTKADTSALAAKLNTADLDTQTAAKINDGASATAGALTATIADEVEASTYLPTAYAGLDQTNGAVLNADGARIPDVSASVRPHHHRVLHVGAGRTYTTVDAAVTAAWADGDGYSDQPANTGGLDVDFLSRSGVRFRGGRPMFYRTAILIDPGTYTLTVNLEIGSGIDLIGLGATPQDTVLVNATSNYNARSWGSVFISNLTLHHAQGPTGNNYPFHGSYVNGVPFFTTVFDRVEFRDTNTASSGTCGYDLPPGGFILFYRCKFNSTTGHDTNLHDNSVATAGADYPITVVYLECEGPTSNYEALLSNMQNGEVWRTDCVDENGAPVANAVATDNAAFVTTDARPPLPVGGMQPQERAQYLPTLAKKPSRVLLPRYPDAPAAMDPVDGRTYYIPLEAVPFSYIGSKARIWVTTIGGLVAAGAHFAAAASGSGEPVTPSVILVPGTARTATLGAMDFELTSGPFNTMFVMIGMRVYVAARAASGVQILGSALMSTVHTCYYKDGDAGNDIPSFPASLSTVAAGDPVPFVGLLTA